MVGLTPLATPIVIDESSARPVFAERLRDFMKRPGAPQ
jgi:hypothetical protein